MKQKPYTVAELIATLQKEDPNRIVIMSSDAEGNDYSPLFSVAPCAYNKRDREVGMESLTEKDKQQGYTEEDVMVGGTPAICLYRS